MFFSRLKDFKSSDELENLKLLSNFCEEIFSLLV